MTSSPNPVAIYARVSTDGQVQGRTIDSQMEALVQRLREEGRTLAPNLRFIDDGYSGSTLVRPALEQLRDRAAAGEFDRLHVHSPDRLARSYVHQMLLVDELRQAGVELVFLNHPLGQSPEDHLLLQMQGMMAEYERAKILERSRRGKLHAARAGCVSAFGKAPYGYRYIRKAEGQGEARWAIHSEEAEVVCTMFRWMGLEGCSLAEIGRRLHQKGIRTQHGLDRWLSRTIWGILKNPAYIGTAYFNKTTSTERRKRLRPNRGQPAHPRRVRSLQTNPLDKQIAIPVPAILDEALFQAVQDRLDENRKRNRRPPQGTRYVLQGLVVCGTCGYAFGAPSDLPDEDSSRRAVKGVEGEQLGGHAVRSDPYTRVRSYAAPGPETGPHDEVGVIVVVEVLHHDPHPAAAGGVPREEVRDLHLPVRQQVKTA